MVDGVCHFPNEPLTVPVTTYKVVEFGSIPRIAILDIQHEINNMFDGLEEPPAHLVMDSDDQIDSLEVPAVFLTLHTGVLHKYPFIEVGLDSDSFETVAIFKTK